MSSDPNTDTPPEKALERKPKLGDNATAMDFSTGENFALLQRVAGMLSDSDLVPAIYKGKMANCMIALNMAERLRADPLMVMQNLYIVQGKPGWSATFKIATFNQNGGFSKLRYEWKGEANTPEWGCRAWAIEKLTNERLDGPWITWKLANDEGWVNKSGSKWKTMPLKMFMYRAGAWFVDVYAPELSMGLPATEDLEDSGIIDLTPGADGYGYQEQPPPAPEPQKAPTAVLADQLKAKREAKGPATASKAQPPATPPPEEPAAEEPEEPAAESAPATEEPKEATEPVNDGGMATQDEQKAELDALMEKARKANKASAAKAKVAGAFKLRSYDSLAPENYGGAIDILTAYLEE